MIWLALLACAAPPSDDSAADDAPPHVLINEFVASNQGTVADEQGEYDDWIELWTDEDEPVALAGMTMSADLADPGAFALDDGLAVPPGGWLLLWADGTPEQGPAHLGFRLDHAGGEIGLFDADGEPLDEVIYERQATDRSAARIPDGGDVWEIRDRPTPRAANE